MEKNRTRHYRIGIIGGMGPMAGVLLQELIIEATPGTKDQDHLEVICFTNPHIPDRTRSLLEDDGKNYTESIIDSIKILEVAGVNCIIIPCNTAHARLDIIQKGIRVPILNMIEITLNKLKRDGTNTVGLLATDATIASGIFASSPEIRIMVPDRDGQKNVMDTIRAVKAGQYDDKRIASILEARIAELRQKGAQKVILGCTELSLYSAFLDRATIIDPLLEIAKEAVMLALDSSAKIPYTSKIPIS